jgi:hypothetical protein
MIDTRHAHWKWRASDGAVVITVTIIIIIVKQISQSLSATRLLRHQSSIIIIITMTIMTIIRSCSTLLFRLPAHVLSLDP